MISRIKSTNHYFTINADPTRYHIHFSNVQRVEMCWVYLSQSLPAMRRPLGNQTDLRGPIGCEILRVENSAKNSSFMFSFSRRFHMARGHRNKGSWSHHCSHLSVQVDIRLFSPTLARMVGVDAKANSVMPRVSQRGNAAHMGLLAWESSEYRAVPVRLFLLNNCDSLGRPNRMSPKT